MKKFTALTLSLVMTFSILCFVGCNDSENSKCEHLYVEQITKEATCAETGLKTFTCSLCENTYTENIPKTNEHYGCYTCNYCNHSFIKDFQDFVDANKNEDGFVAIIGTSYYVALMYTDDFAMYIYVYHDFEIATEELTLGFKEHYSMNDSEWLYGYEMAEETRATGSFHTQKAGYYLPYSYSMASFKDLILELFNNAMKTVQQAFKDGGSDLTIQQIGLKV